jgi:hypothetical protein
MTHQTIINIPLGISFAQRETHINREIDKIQREFVSKGLRVSSFEVTNKSDQKATVLFHYN